MNLMVSSRMCSLKLNATRSLFWIDIVSMEGVTKLLKGLNPFKVLGPDWLHSRVLKELATELGPVFAHLFQQSIDTCEIPSERSLANICSLFNHIVCSNIMAHLDERKLL